MFFSLWLGIVLADGMTGCATPNSQPQTASAPPQEMSQQAFPPPPSAPVPAPRGARRNPDFDSLPKVPSPGAKVTYSSVHVNGPYIAITFDDGPHHANTPKLLDMLRERNIKASASLCLAIVGACYISVFLSRYMGSYGLDPTLSAWLPVLIFGPIGVVMLDTIKT